MMVVMVIASLTVMMIVMRTNFAWWIGLCGSDWFIGLHLSDLRELGDSVGGCLGGGGAEGVDEVGLEGYWACSDASGFGE